MDLLYKIVIHVLVESILLKLNMTTIFNIYINAISLDICVLMILCRGFKIQTQDNVYWIIVYYAALIKLNRI